MNTKERLLEFIKAVDSFPSKFEEDCELSNGYINSIRKSIGEKALEKILNKYPELNKVWLLMGIGEMKNKKMEDEKKPPTEITAADPTMEIIKQLVMNNAHLCRSNENLSVGNLKQTVMMENFVSLDKAEESRLTQLVQGRIIKLLAAQGVGDKWNTLDEGIEVLGKYLLDALIPSKV